MRARLIRRCIRNEIVRDDHAVRQHPRFDFFAADVRQHLAVDLHARTEHLTALLDHLLTFSRVVDDVSIFKRQIVFAEDSADAVAPAAGRFQVSDDFRFVLKINS